MTDRQVTLQIEQATAARREADARVQRSRAQALRARGRASALHGSCSRELIAQQGGRARTPGRRGRRPRGAGGRGRARDERTRSSAWPAWARSSSKPCAPSATHWRASNGRPRHRLPSSAATWSISRYRQPDRRSRAHPRRGAWRARRGRNAALHARGSRPALRESLRAGAEHRQGRTGPGGTRLCERLPRRPLRRASAGCDRRRNSRRRTSRHARSV